MNAGWRYRVLSVLGTVGLTALAVWVTNLATVHTAFAQIPYFGRPAPNVVASEQLIFVIGTTAVVFLAAMWPLFKPQPRRILDTVLLTQKRVILAMVFLAALGYFNYTYRLPRATVMLTTATLLVALPVYMVAIRRPPQSTSRAVIIGDDPDAMSSLLASTDLPVVGYISPPSAYAPDGFNTVEVSVTDGGDIETKLDALPCLGGLARLEEAFVEYDVDTALLAFSTTDREDFFGTLEHCHDHGVTALVHRDHADHVLTDKLTGEELLTVDLEPWDWQEYVVKRLFDITFATVALLVTAPLILLISVAIKLDDGGPLFYRQERTAAFGRTFTIHKFRSMTPATEDSSPDSTEEYRITRVGHILRKTHLDEIPQLWAILKGEMSVVGPRAVWTDEEVHLEAETNAWRKRWFIKPGLTGLAQIHGATSADAETKLRYDLQYIREQSFWFDLKIVVRQLWGVGSDMIGFVTGATDDEESTPEITVESEQRAESVASPTEEVEGERSSERSERIELSAGNEDDD